MTDNDPFARQNPDPSASGTPESGAGPGHEQPSPWAPPGRTEQPRESEASPDQVSPGQQPAQGHPGYPQQPGGAFAHGNPYVPGYGTRQDQGFPYGAGAHAAPGQGAHPMTAYPSYPGGAETGPTTGTGRGLPRRLIAAVALVALLVGGGAGAAGGYLAASGGSSGSGGVNALDQPKPAEQTNDAPPGSVQAVAEQVMPSVVQLQVRGGNTAGEGSGFILSGDGYILTNNHVVEAAANGGRIQVVFQDGRRAQAEVVGRDPTTDVAVVRAQGVNGLPTVKLGRSDNLAVGQRVVAIGSPFDLAGTVTSGIVSSLHRPVTANGQDGQATVMDAIQTDAAINPGNSGGPLLNMQGRVVGINSAIYSPQTAGGPGGGQGGNVGIGFSIPIDQARRTADEIIENGYATQTFIGAMVGTAPQGGAVIREVQPDSPAARAGLEAGDVIVRMGERRIDESNTLVAAIRTRAPGEQVTFTLADDSTVQATLGGQRVTVN